MVVIERLEGLLLMDLGWGLLAVPFPVPRDHGQETAPS